jgi:hypothetical protein
MTLGVAAAAGAVAGAVGTAAMDTLLYTRHRRGFGQEQPLEWEFGGVNTWDDASTPGQVGRRLEEAVLRHPAPDGWAQATQNAVHWATGMSWGAQFGVAARLAHRASWRSGLVLGVLAWATSYVVLPRAKLYKPIWEYDAKTLADDLGAHLVYGASTGAAFAWLARDA